MIPLPSPNVSVTKNAYYPLGEEFSRWLRDRFILGVRERFHAVEVSDDYVARPWDEVNADPSGGGFTVTLPENPNDGAEVAYYNTTTSTNAVTFEPGSLDDTIQEQSSITNAAPRGTELFRYSSSRRNWSRS